MKLTPLTLEHALPLLHFELENRDWFEQNIEPREQDFYSLTGVQTHIAEMLLDKSLNKGLPLLITDTNDQIIGRINLHNITCGKAFLGYRLSAQHTGKGVTKSAIIKLLPMAKELGIKRLVAMVSTENIASQKVIESQSFTAVKKHRNFAVVQGNPFDCIEYWLELTSAEN